MVVNIIRHIGIVALLSPLLLGMIGKTKAFFAGRWGPPLLQPYYDLVKLFKKGNVYSTTTTWIFQAAPVVAMAAALVASAFLPMGALKAPLAFWGDLILFAALFGLAKFFIILAALDTGSSFEGMGASREAAFSCLAEVVLFLDFIILTLWSKNFILSEILEKNISSAWPLFGSVFLLVGASFFLVLLAENARIPVDDPATHLELTMIHEVMVLDHSGWDLAYVLYGSAIKLFVFSSLLINILIPSHNLSQVAQTIVFGGGMLFLACVLGTVESSMARLRLNRVPQMLIGAIVLALVGFFVVLMKGV